MRKSKEDKGRQLLETLKDAGLTVETQRVISIKDPLTPDVSGLTVTERQQMYKWWFEEFYPKHFKCLLDDMEYFDVLQDPEIQELRIKSEKQKLQTQQEKYDFEKKQLEFKNKELTLKHKQLADEESLHKLKTDTERKKLQDQLKPKVKPIRDYTQMTELEFQDFVISIIGATPNKHKEGCDALLPNTSVEIKHGVKVDKKMIDKLYSDMKSNNTLKGLLIHSGLVTTPARTLAKQRNIEIRHVTELLG